MLLRISLFLILVLGATCLEGQTVPAAPPTSTPVGIQDNSFLLEEAYNQEEGVVQHIFGFTRSLDEKQWVATFSQEWPLHGLRHQLAYTLTGLSGSVPRSGAGFGDLEIEYRYQAVGDAESRLAVAPRAGLIIPSGDHLAGRGNGGFGFEAGVPVSYMLLPKLAMHVNADVTFIPRARNEFGDRASTNAVGLGQSFVWLAKPNFNLMLETVWENTASVSGPQITTRSNEIFISPGVRWAYNFKSGLQIVPGIAVPIGLGSSAGEKQILFYLSFEHRFKRERS